MSETFRRTGFVTTAAGDPVSGAFVTIKDASVRVPEIAIVTDAGGRFEMRLPAGVFTLRVYAGGGITDIRIVSPEERAIDIVMRSAG